MSSRAQVVNTTFLSGGNINVSLSSCRSFRTTVFSKLSSAAVIIQAFDVSVRLCEKSCFAGYIRLRIRWIRYLSEVLAQPHHAGPAYRMRLMVAAFTTLQRQVWQPVRSQQMEGIDGARSCIDERYFLLTRSWIGKEILSIKLKCDTHCIITTLIGSLVLISPI